MIRLAKEGDRGRLLREYRKAHGVRLEDLAERLGTTISALSRRETGHVRMSESEWLRALAAIAEIAEGRTSLEIMKTG